MENTSISNRDIRQRKVVNLFLIIISYSMDVQKKEKKRKPFGFDFDEKK